MKNKHYPSATLRGSRVDEPMINDLVLPKAVFESALEGVKDLIEGRRLYGVVRHEEDYIESETPLHLVSHIIDEVFLDEEDHMTCRVTFLETERGKEAIENLDSLRIGYRGFGTVENGVIQKDFTLLGFDLYYDN